VKMPAMETTEEEVAAEEDAVEDQVQA